MTAKILKMPTQRVIIAEKNLSLWAKAHLALFGRKK